MCFSSTDRNPHNAMKLMCLTQRPQGTQRRIDLSFLCEPCVLCVKRSLYICHGRHSDRLCVSQRRGVSPSRSKLLLATPPCRSIAAGLSPFCQIPPERLSDNLPYSPHNGHCEGVKRPTQSSAAHCPEQSAGSLGSAKRSFDPPAAASGRLACESDCHAPSGRSQ